MNCQTRAKSLFSSKTLKLLLLTFLGMTPVVGFVADIANAGISAARGNYAAASIDLAAAVPGIGQAAAGAKLAGVGIGLARIGRGTDSLGSAANKTSAKFYRYVGEGEAAAIRRSGEIPNFDRFGTSKDVYFTDRIYQTAGRAKTYNQLPNKPTHRIEIDPANVPSRSPFTRVNPGDNPQWGVGGGVEATTRNPIPVDPSTLTRLRGAP